MAVEEVEPQGSESTIAGTVLDLVTVATQEAIVADSLGRPQAVPGLWIDAYVPRSSPVIVAWRRDPGSRFPVRLRLNDGTWQGEVVVTGVEWGLDPDLVRIQAQAIGPLVRVEP